MNKKYIFIEHYQDENNRQATRYIYEMPEEEFANIAPANDKVFEIYRLEELFAILADNLFSFNNVITSYSDKARVQSMFWGNYFQQRIDVNRAALNFFATLNLYQDFLENNMGDVFGKDFWENNVEFQRCIVMRNYIQHIEFFPIISKVSYTRCDLNVSLASVRFQMDAHKLKVDRLCKGTRKKFHTFFSPDEKIDLYEIINRGMGKIQLIQKQIREMPLYTIEYKTSKDFLLEIEKKIKRKKTCLMNSHIYIEADGDSRNLQCCTIATDTIQFIDNNIERYSCQYSSANHFITTAPQEFVKKCSLR